MRTKKKTFKDYHSSDYGNEEEEDYGQDYPEDEDDFDDANNPDNDDLRRRARAQSNESDF
jgi:hypothetical protein